ncbi:MAG: Nramp family divalent metal transporter [bacterium]|nr:Nramp family divalent metal transporter [bacterium]
MPLGLQQSLQHYLPQRLRRPLRRVAIFFAIVGPGLITANVDNDAGGIATYSQAGAHFGLNVLWLYLPLAFMLIVVQEMSNRMGVVTGKGLSDLIREKFGVKLTFYLMLGLLITNFGNVIAEFSGVAAAGEIWGIPRWVSVPLAALAVWFLAVKGNYKTVERIFLVAVVFYVSYLIAGVQAKPDWNQVLHHSITPHIEPDPKYLMMLIGLIGTTIAPWMQFYQQASVAEKNIHLSQYFYSKLDTIIGCIAVMVVAGFITVLCAETLFPHGVRIETAGDAAKSLLPFAGDFAADLFAFGLLNASLFAASILPLSTSYTICEAFGWESGVDKEWNEARQFYTIYTGLIALGAALVLIPSLPLIDIMIISQQVNGMVLPFVLIPMLLLVNDKSIMGKYRNGWIGNTIAIGLTVLIILLTVGSFIV